MQTRSKTILLVTLTLIIGMAIGSVLTVTIIRNYFSRDRVSKMRTPEGFVSRYEKIIEPAEQQREQVRQLLLDQFRMIDSTSTQYYSDMRALRDSLSKKLQPMLTPEQQERWLEFQAKYRDRKHYTKRK